MQLSLVLFLTFFLVIFNIILSVGGVPSTLFDFSKGLRTIDLVIDASYLLLLSFLLILYRRWKAEMMRRKSSEETLVSLQKVVEIMQIGVTIADSNGKILYANPAEAEMHGYQVEELIGKDVRIFAPPEIWNPVFQPRLKRFKRETTNVTKDGSSFPVQLMSDVVYTPDGDVLAVITTCEDITERRKHEETIKKLAFYDALTGLPNRALFNDRLRQEVAKARRHKKLLAVMFVDLDCFKTVNDTLGHNTGDLLIKAVSRRLQNIIREGDTVCRLGGDEFVMLFTDATDLEDFSVVAGKILEKLSDAFVLNEKEVSITVSIGISTFPENGDDIEMLVKNADAAMYYAKEQGRNNYQFYSPAINENAMVKMKLLNGLRKAVIQDEIIVHYQPQVDLRSGAIVGAEALARWQHPDYGLVGPKEFIPLAEESGLITSIGEFLLFTACAQNKAWQEAGFAPIRMAVNISTYQFIHKDFIRIIKKILEEINLEPKYLELEFTETIVMKNSDITSSILHELKSLGVQCSIDDFGTGYSSLSYLKYLPIDRIKLDKSFVCSLTRDTGDDAISKAVIAMAHDLNLKVTAEGVETVQQLNFLHTHNCDDAQGFLFSRPLPAKDFVKMLIEEEHKVAAKDVAVFR